MPIFDPIPYSYVPTAPRIKSTTPRQTHAQEQLSTSNKTAIDDESYKSQIREIDTVCDTSQKDIDLGELGIGNASWEDETASYPKDRYPSSKKNESVPTLNNKPLILENHESNLFDSGCSVHASSVPELNKQNRFIDHTTWLNMENDGSSEDNNISLSQQDIVNIPSQEKPYYCDNSPQPTQSEIDLHTNDEVAQHRSMTSSYYNRPVPLAVENREPNQGNVFGCEVGLFPVFDKQKELLAASQKKDDNTENRKKRLYSLKTEIDSDDKNDEDPQPAKRRKLYPLPTNNVPVSSPDYCILTPSSTPQSELDEVQGQGLNEYSSRFTDDDYPQTSSSPSIIVESAPIAEYHEWPFQGFLKRTKIGNDTTYNLEFQLQHIPEPLHLPILSEALNVGSRQTTPVEALNPRNIFQTYQNRKQY
ncbi:hypothetical protein ACHAO8_010048 [Botrytis cinerea]